MILTRILGYWFILVIVLILALLATMFFAPGWAGVVAGIIFLLNLTLGIFSIVQNQMKLFREKQISRKVLALNVLYEIVFILLAIILAGLLGRTIAEIATKQINNDLTKLITGIIIGLLAGVSVGVLMKRIWGRQP